MILLLFACFISVLGLVGSIGYWFLKSPDEAAAKTKPSDEPSVFFETPHETAEDAGFLRNLGRGWTPKPRRQE